MGLLRRGGYRQENIFLRKKLKVKKVERNQKKGQKHISVEKRDKDIPQKIIK